jgi:hypothetical protein
MALLRTDLWISEQPSHGALVGAEQVCDLALGELQLAAQERDGVVRAADLAQAGGDN